MSEEMKQEPQRTEEDRELLQLLEMMSQIPETPVPDQFDLRLHRALKQERAKKKRTVWKRWTAAAACLLVGLVSFHMAESGMIGGDMQEDGKEATYDSYFLAAPEGEGSGEQNQDVTPSHNAAEENDGVAPLAEEGSSEGDRIPAYDERQVIDDPEAKEAISRGALASETHRAFQADCDYVIQRMAESIEAGDSWEMAEAMNYKNQVGYSADGMEQAMKLYGDLFQGEDISWSRINLTSWSHSNVYRISGETRELMVVISDTEDGLKISEPVMEHAQWLYDQTGDREFTLTGIDYLSEDERMVIEFEIIMEDEVRSFVWDGTESL